MPVNSTTMKWRFGTVLEQSTRAHEKTLEGALTKQVLSIYIQYIHTIHRHPYIVLHTLLSSDLDVLGFTTRQSSPQNRQCSVKLKLGWLECKSKISVAQCQMTPLKVWLHTALDCNYQSFVCPIRMTYQTFACLRIFTLCLLSLSKYRSMWCFEQYLIKQFWWHVTCVVPSSILWRKPSSRCRLALNDTSYACWLNEFAINTITNKTGHIQCFK